MSGNSADIGVGIITLNEEENIGKCLRSIEGWAGEIHLIDSYSTDDTVDIAEEYDCEIHQISEGHWAKIRNWAIESIDWESEWIVFLDADEEVSAELQNEMDSKITPDTSENGFYIPRKFIFLGRWLKYGRCYEDVLRLYRRDRVEYVESGDVEYAKVEGEVGSLNQDLIHEDLKPFSDWVSKHNRISSRAVKRHYEEKHGERASLLDADSSENVEGGVRHVIRERIWDRLPLLVRPFVFFIYAYVFRLGFLDGTEGLVYHIHHKLWYRLLVYTKAKEFERTDKTLDDI